MITTCPQCGSPTVYTGPLELEGGRFIYGICDAYCFHCELTWDNYTVQAYQEEQEWWAEGRLEAALEAGQLALPGIEAAA